MAGPVYIYTGTFSSCQVYNGADTDKHGIETTSRARCIFSAKQKWVGKVKLVADLCTKLFMCMHGDITGLLAVKTKKKENTSLQILYCLLVVVQKHSFLMFSFERA